MESIVKCILPKGNSSALMIMNLNNLKDNFWR